MTTPDHPDADPRFETQVAGALRQRGAEVDVAGDGRAAIDRRIGQRKRHRRARRVGVAAVVLLIALAGTLTVLRRGHDDSRVVTVPGVPAVHIPQLGLPSGSGTNRIENYSPGRQLTEYLQPPAGSSDPGGAQLTLTVTEASLSDVAHESGHWTGAEPITLNGQPAVSYPAIPGGPQMTASVVWHADDHVVAELVVLNPDQSGQPPHLADQLAAGLVELDDQAWAGLLEPQGVNRRNVALAVLGNDGHTEISYYAPTDASGGGGGLGEVLDVPGYAPGTFTLVTFFVRITPSTPSSEPPGLVGTTPATSGGGPDSMIVRGSSAVVLAPPADVEVPDDFQSQLIWNEDGMQYRLEFKHAVSPQDAAKVADRLSRPSMADWQALLFPSTLRTDLVPMPTVRPTGDAGDAGTTGTTGG